MGGIAATAALPLDVEKVVLATSETDSGDVILVNWDGDDDPGNPFNWSPARKYTMVLCACSITALTALNATSMAIMSTWGPAYFGTSRLHFVLGLTLYNLSVSMAPLVLAPLSENLGRNEIYHVTSFLTALLFIPQAIFDNISAYLAVRFLQGAVSSVGVTMVGGTIADLFRASERGPAMNLFSLINFLGQAGGGLTMGWVGQNLGFQWCYGVQGIAAAVSFIVNAAILRETRADKILSGRARKLTQQTGVQHACKADLQHKSFMSMLRVTAVRPLQYLFTEPIVTVLSLWIGFAWAVIYLGGTATMLVFRQYGFSDGQTGSIQACIGIGGVIGFLSNYHQEHLYRRAAARSVTGHAPPEARLYWAAMGGVLFPVGMLVFAWTGTPDIHWAVPAVMLCISYWGVFCMYLGVFNYLADAYETFSSSAQAAQGLTRNVVAGIFPLFGQQMYKGMGYAHASTLVAGVGFLLAIAPFMLIRYGAQLRARSPVTSSLAPQ